MHLEFVLIYLFLFFLDNANWIDVCPIDGNLLATGGTSRLINIFDKRASKLVNIFYNVHSGMVL